MSPATHRPTIMGTRHMIAAGHYLATLAGFELLEAGGNAVDAGVCTGLALSVLESAYVSFAGVAPIAIYLRETGQVITISGLGTWPRAASCDFFQRRYNGEVPKGILRSVVPAAPDAWLLALRDYGTMSFGDVAAAAIRFARNGFPMYELMASTIAASAKEIATWPSSAALFLPNGAAPEVGTVFRQTELAATLQYMADTEKSVAAKGRAAGVSAARDAFYRGDVARAIATFHAANGGLLTMEDLASYQSEIEPAIKTRFADVDVYGCGPWCQGPMLLQELNILDGMDLRALGQNSLAYVHLLTETIKLAAADREAYYGDPRFVDVPLERLLSREHAAERRRSIDPDRACPELPPAGKVGVTRGIELDTSYVCVVDQHGNAFSATPSDGMTASPVIPGMGCVASPRGSQSWADPAHPSALAPGKRPRLTPNPAIAICEGQFVMPFGTPGADTQTQVMLQVFLNMVVFGMEPQAAVEAPRFASLSFPSSSSPHKNSPGRLLVEVPLHHEALHNGLARLGHKVEAWPETGPDYFQNVSAACAIRSDLTTGVLHGAADPRRPAYAIGW
jgi:gamma-glutamyltranspeptidase / glutathione hydrolase